jgi:hypothetical protein
MTLNLRCFLKICLITLCVLTLTAAPIPAEAQYYQALEAGYSLKSVPAKDALLKVTPAPLVIAAQSASQPGTSLNCLLKLQAGMRRRLDQTYIEELDPFFAEQRIIPPADWAGRDFENLQVGYANAGGQVYLGLGIAYEDDNEWGLGLLVSYLQRPDGSFREIARHELGHEYIGSVFVLDANNDGLLNVIASWMTGAGAGGGVDLLTVQPDGSFSYFGDSSDPDNFASQLWSAHGSVELMDYDNDGDWELQLTYPLFFSAAGYSYRDIVSFDVATNQWAYDADFAPEYYAAQDHFYAQLYMQVKALVANPARFHHNTDDYYMQYTCTIDGEEYSLVPFINENGTPNPDWIEELKIFVEGGPEPLGLRPFNESSEA